MNKKVVVFILLASVLQVNAWSLSPKPIYNITKIFDNPHTFSIVNIKVLSKFSAKELGQHLGKFKLSNKILEDIYIRIAIYKKIITREAAQGIFARLSSRPLKTHSTKTKSTHSTNSQNQQNLFFV